MDLKSVSANRLHVKDLAASTAFYEKLGFRLGKQTDRSVTFYLNWYSVELQLATGETPYGAGGLVMCTKVDGIQKAHDFAVEQGLKPDITPTKALNGNTEFTLNDPDGYTLLFFDK